MDTVTVYRIEYKGDPKKGAWQNAVRSRLRLRSGIEAYEAGKEPDQNHHPSDGPGLWDDCHNGNNIRDRHNDRRFFGAVAADDLTYWFPCRKGRSAMQRRGWHLVVYEAAAEDVFHGFRQVTFTISEAVRVKRLSLVTFKPLGA